MHPPKSGAPHVTRRAPSTPPAFHTSGNLLHSFQGDDYDVLSKELDMLVIEAEANKSGDGMILVDSRFAQFEFVLDPNLS